MTRPSRLSPCPGVCDDDCTAACHEGHHVPWKREHHPDDCLGTAPPHLRGEWQALTPDEQNDVIRWCEREDFRRSWARAEEAGTVGVTSGPCGDVKPGTYGSAYIPVCDLAPGHAGRHAAHSRLGGVIQAWPEFQTASNASSDPPPQP